ncbi:hypothetical protein MRBLMS1_001999 [Massilia sp. LMS1-1-1.1]
MRPYPVIPVHQVWAARKHPFRAGWLFSVYLVLAGAERLLIKEIRVNVKFELAGIQFTQAQFIALVFLGIGAIGMAVLNRRAPAELSGSTKQRKGKPSV